MEQLVLCIAFLIIAVLCLIYSIISGKLDFNNKTIINTICKTKDIDDDMKHLIELSLRKVKGWNVITKYYTILHYFLNIVSILFSCVSIYYSYIEYNEFAIIASIVAVLSITFNLFLRSDRKWATFRQVLAEARIKTNTFIADWRKAKDIEEYIKQYANEIITLEKSIKDSEIS